MITGAAITISIPTTMKPISCPNCNTLSGIGFATQEDALKVTECVRDLSETITDILPQMGKIVLQDYAKLNRGLMAAREILEQYNQTPPAKPNQ